MIAGRRTAPRDRKSAALNGHRSDFTPAELEYLGVEARSGRRAYGWHTPNLASEDGVETAQWVAVLEEILGR